MKHVIVSLTALLISVSAAQAACYADYKAKRGDPLRLHYGVAEVKGDCTEDNAEKEIAKRIARDGWELLDVVSVFSDDGLDERRANAGEFYLRY